jgi:uncharacterized protein (DUF58 family)
MTIQSIVGVVLIVLGVWLGVALAVILGIVALLLDVARAAWGRGTMRRVHYERRLGRDRTAWGEDIPLEIEAWNRSALPLPWLRADDEVSIGAAVREHAVAIGRSGSFTLRNAWTLAPFERVVRRFHIGGARRGVFRIGPVALTAGDLFASEAATADLPAVDRFLVRPRVVPSSPLRRRDETGGLDRARAGLSEDPARFAGIRPWAPGDPVRRIHARTSARLGRPVVKRFEPSRQREVLIALDVQTAPGPHWEVTYDDDAVEGLIVVAASLARALAVERASFGVAAAAYTGAESRFALLPLSSEPGQAARVLDLLARVSSHPSAPFERLLSLVIRTSRPGTTVLLVTARDPSPFAAHIRRLQQAGCHVIVIACGRTAESDAARARAAGFAVRVARLDSPWRTADLLAVSQ